ncbi:MAG: enoyl-CoA hydratase-related protein, partial [Chloroflexota bacterium]
MSYEAIIYEKRTNIGYITLNRPQVMNALNDQLRRELGEALQEARYDTDVAVVILTGAGDRAFSAGL